MLGKNGIAVDNIEKIIAVLRSLKLKRGDIFSQARRRADKLGILIEGLLIAKYGKVDSITAFCR